MRIKQILIALDQLLNATLGGYAGETLSSRCWRLRAEQPYAAARHVIDGLFFWQANHCEKSYLNWKTYVPEANI